jgi:hypothetical protein
MSSATVLFVLKHIAGLPPQEGDERICSMAFGPGLTVETAMFTKVRAPQPEGSHAAIRQSAGTDEAAARTEPSLI